MAETRRDDTGIQLHAEKPATFAARETFHPACQAVPEQAQAEVDTVA